ncbi:MAG: hypothetical protein RSA55_01945, partial [Clostridia bacterium]
ESVVTGWTPTTKLLLLSSAAHAVEREDYADESTALQAQLEILHNAAKSCADNPIRAEELNQQIESKLAAQEACEKNRWSVTQAEAEWVQSASEHIVFAEINPISILAEKQPELFEQFKNGAMDTRRFLQALDEKVQSVYSEYE